MKARSNGEKVLYVLILLGLLGNGLLHLQYLLAEPNLNRFVPWIGILFCGLPFLCVLGVIALVAARRWRVPWVLGISVLVYAGGILAVVNILGRFPYSLIASLVFSIPGNIDTIHIVLWVIVLGIVLLSFVARREEG